MQRVAIDYVKIGMDKKVPLPENGDKKGLPLFENIELENTFDEAELCSDSNSE